jgi:hypothetical protein
MKSEIREPIAEVGNPKHSLAISSPLEITSIERTNGNSVLRFHTFSGQQYTVQYSPETQAGSWTDLPGGTVAGDGHDTAMIDSTAPVAVPVRLYRLRRE